jgi:hypothetical protein
MVSFGSVGQLNGQTESSCLVTPRYWPQSRKRLELRRTSTIIGRLFQVGAGVGKWPQSSERARTLCRRRAVPRSARKRLQLPAYQSSMLDACGPFDFCARRVWPGEKIEVIHRVIRSKRRTARGTRRLAPARLARSTRGRAAPPLSQNCGDVDSPPDGAVKLSMPLRRMVAFPPREFPLDSWLPVV